MSYPIPSFIFNPGSGPITLAPTYPPMQKPGTQEMLAVRHDSDTISGYRQSITERIEKYLTVQFDFVPQAEEANWAAFMSYALTGGAFEYCPDATAPGTFQTYTLDDTDWKPAFTFRAMDKFTLKMRLVAASS